MLSRDVLLDLARVTDGHCLGGLPRVGALRFDLLDNVRPFQHFAEHHVTAVQPRRFDGRDEELGPVGVLAGVGHAQVERSLVLVKQLQQSKNS